MLPIAALAILGMPELRPASRVIRLHPPSRLERFIDHRCGLEHEPPAQLEYSVTVTSCTLHNVSMAVVGANGRPYPAPVCYECLPPHERICPLGNPSVLANWLSGITCICPARLAPLGLGIQKLPFDRKRPTRSPYGVGPAPVDSGSE